MMLRCLVTANQGLFNAKFIKTGKVKELGWKRSVSHHMAVGAVLMTTILPTGNHYQNRQRTNMKTLNAPFGATHYFREGKTINFYKIKFGYRFIWSNGYWHAVKFNLGFAHEIHG